MSDRILIVGKGAAGVSLAADVRRQGGLVLGFLDDRATGKEVLGRLSDVNEVVIANRVDLVYFAIPTASSSKVREFINSISVETVDIAIVPRTYDILAKDTINIDDLTDVDVLDLVGRQPVKHDVLVAHNFLSGKRVLVTGAAGSIGSRLTRHVLAAGAERITCVDWWENGIFQLSRSLGSPADLEFHTIDVKNHAAMNSVFNEVKPDVVFHAAAYKHVPLMQENPLEAINNNVGGTLNLMKLAVDHEVDNFVYVSTDKAVNPANVMGATKRLGEMLMESIAARQPSTHFTAVRFGNVIESNGSVMEIFRSQIASGGPLTVTHPEVTRFFMTIDEASQLIIQSAALGDKNDIYVLDMGEPVRILDLAKSLVRAVNPRLDIEIVGLRPGEKMYEELTYEPDLVGRTSNNKIFVVRGEREFDHVGFLRNVDSLLSKTLQYGISNDEAVQQLRTFGFDV